MYHLRNLIIATVGLEELETLSTYNAAEDFTLMLNRGIGSIVFNGYLEHIATRNELLVNAIRTSDQLPQATASAVNRLSRLSAFML